MVRASAGVLLALLALATSALAAPLSFQLPKAVYDHLGGAWSIEVYSPCHPSVLGNVLFVNETAILSWEANRFPNTTMGAPHGDGEAMQIGGLSPLLTEESQKLSYRICETQENVLATAHRPKYGPTFNPSLLREYTGTVVTADSEACVAGAARDVVIRTIGTMEPPAGSPDWKRKEAIQYVEMVVNTAKFAGNCGQKSDVAADPEVAAVGKKSRRRRGYRGASELSTPSEFSEKVVDRGFAVIRFSKRSPPVKSFYERYKATIIFAVTFIGFRLVYTFFSTKAGWS